MKNKEKIIGSVVILIVFAVFLIYGLLSKEEKQYGENDIFIESSKETPVEEKQVEQKENKSIKVQIKGAVKMPGVYTLDSGARVEDLIKLSGGFTEDADTDKLISQAKKLRDEECITVLKKGDTTEQTVLNEKVATQTTINVANITDKVNINVATKEELMNVPGIGETIATNIIQYREKNGDFKTVDELKNVDRIGEKTLEKMKDSLEIN